jgi:hypothetical protein
MENKGVPKNIQSAFNIDGAYYTAYPQQPSYNPHCAVNIKYDTLSNNFPRKTTTWGPTSLKHLYTGIPNYYPVQKISRPVGTMYDYDTSSFGPFGIRETYGFQAYPFHHVSNREVREYSREIIPVLDLFEQTKYKTQFDGSWER